MADLVGKILANRYQVVEFIGRGGMAEVYKVWDPDRMIYLAAKVLLKSLAMDRVFLRRFKREAESLAKLQHPNIVRYYGLYHDADVAFMLLDFIEGFSLQEWIFKQGSQLSPDMILKIARSVCSALHYAHTEDLVHCDIKPGNIMVNQNNDILLTDFGIARMTDAATATMVGFGTPAYMAPELVYGKDPSPQSDIYSFGIVLYEMVTGGERPFTGEQARTTGATSEKVRWEQVYLAPPPPSQYNPLLSKQLEAVILRCLVKDPGIRFGSALELLNSIERASTGNLNTLDWPKQESEKPTLSHQTVPSTPFIAPQPEAKPRRDAFKPPPNTNTKGNRAIIPAFAFAGIGIIVLILVLSLGRNQRRTNQLALTQLAESSRDSLNPVGTEVHETAEDMISEVPATQVDTSNVMVTFTSIPASPTPEQAPTKKPTESPIALFDITPTPRRYYPLSNCAASQLKIGDSAFISYDGGKNSIRSEPDTQPSDNKIAVVYPGEVLLITGGPVCNHGWLLWEVQTTRHEIGWTPETNGKDFWVLPLTTAPLCNGAMPSRLVVGKKAKVNEEPPQANLLRPEPSRFHDHIGRIPPGEWMQVLEGPHCGEFTAWWKVQSLATGVIGWTMESEPGLYYLSPEP